MAEFPNEPVYQRTVLEMLAVAHDFCQYCQQVEEKNAQEITAYLQKILPLLYLKGELLPEVEPEYQEAAERFVTEEEWESLFNRLRAVFGEEDIFYTYDPASYGWGESLKASLSEHIADIYQDLRDFVLLYQKNSRAAKENAVAGCRELFIRRWGPRIASMIVALHTLRYGKYGPFYDEENI